jgi:glycine C-acetyltransferase
MNILQQRLAATLDGLHSAGTYKLLRTLSTPMAPAATLEGIGEVLVFCSNNYLGLADHPKVVESAAAGLKRYGAGTASVRFICGTFECHETLEHKVAEFLGAEAALSYTSCWNANEGLLPALVEEGDAIVSDANNHASIIDAGRLASQSTRKVFAHQDMNALKQALTETVHSELQLVVTDGVFSMEGDVAKLPEMASLCRQHDAVLVVDDSHGTGVLGPRGGGSAEHYQLPIGAEGVDIVTSTFGKALGGGNGGFVAGSAELVDYLVQRSRPHLFSNALAPPLACAAYEAICILEQEPERVARLHANVETMRDGLTEIGYSVIDSPTGIIPIMIGDTAEAIRLSDRLLSMGIFVVGFGFPVVPEGHARLRVQMSSEHSAAQIEQTLEAFAALRAEGGH